jgi:hypothetical protein
MRRRLFILGLLLAWLAQPATAWAHVGAPYPVLLEEPVGPYLASALADPDVGQGTFYVMVELPDGQPLPPDTTVTVSIAPEDRHLAEAAYPSQREQTRYGERFVAEVPFDTKGPWQVRLVIRGATGQGEISFPVEVTPSGIGLLASLACLVPFLILGGLWLRGARRQRSSL